MMRYFVSYAAHRQGGGGFFGNVIADSRLVEHWTAAALADAQRFVPGQAVRVVILSFQPLGTMRATDVVGYWIASQIQRIFRAFFAKARSRALTSLDRCRMN